MPSSAASVSLSGRSARCERVAPQPRDELGAADDDARLRAAEQLVAGEADEVGAGRERRGDERLVGRAASEAAGAEVVDERQAVPARDGGELASAGRSVKPTVRKFDWWTRSSSAVSRPDRRLVVGGPGAVRRADLDEARAGAREHVGDAEAAADLDQLAARDDHLAARRRARRARAARAAALLLTTSASSAPVSSRSSAREVVVARRRARPSSRSYSRFE